MKLNRFFERREFACKCGCGFDTVDAELLELLAEIRVHFNSPVIITSGARCVIQNMEAGGASTSQHLYGKAADIVLKDVPAKLVADYVDREYPETYGIGRAAGYTHLDVRKDKARWTY